MGILLHYDYHLDFIWIVTLLVLEVIGILVYHYYKACHNLIGDWFDVWWTGSGSKFSVLMTMIPIDTSIIQVMLLVLSLLVWWPLFNHSFYWLPA